MILNSRHVVTILAAYTEARNASELDAKSTTVGKSREGTRRGAGQSREAVKQDERVEFTSTLAFVARDMHAPLATKDAVAQRARDRSVFHCASKTNVPDE